MREDFVQNFGRKLFAELCVFTENDYSPLNTLVGPHFRIFPSILALFQELVSIKLDALFIYATQFSNPFSIYCKRKKERNKGF
jgi:hypothetical protein